MDSFKNCVGFITGGASGIGLGVARALGQKGMTLVLADVEPDTLSAPAALKNAIDLVFMSPGFRNKPCAFVGYSISPTGAVRAIEHLIQIVNTLEAMPLRNAVMIGKVGEAFNEQGKPVDPMTTLIAQIMADDIF